MSIEWVKREDESPPENERIMIFSPSYAKHTGMRYRFIDSVFFDKVRDATHWALATDPLTEDPE